MEDCVRPHLFNYLNNDPIIIIIINTLKRCIKLQNKQSAL